MPEQVEAVAIGGGQAGLAISYYLTQQGRPHVVLEQAPQIARRSRFQQQLKAGVRLFNGSTHPVM